MFVKVEPSGCCERKGLVQIRFCMYLDPTDYGYEKHHTEIDGEWQDNPFHNHFIYVEPGTTDKEIAEIGKAFLAEAYIKWEGEEKLDLKNPPVTRPLDIDNARIKACEAKVKHLKETVLERQR